MIEMGCKHQLVCSLKITLCDRQYETLQGSTCNYSHVLFDSFRILPATKQSKYRDDTAIRGS